MGASATQFRAPATQRLPVRLSLENTNPDAPLHAGLSATVEVDTHYGRPWLVWLQRGYDRLFGTARATETN